MTCEICSFVVLPMFNIIYISLRAKLKISNEIRITNMIA